jgi:hypothetical protein
MIFASMGHIYFIIVQRFTGKSNYQEFVADASNKAPASAGALGSAMRSGKDLSVNLSNL